MRRLASVPPYFLIVGLAGLVMLGKTFGLVWEGLTADGVPAGFANKDFANYWTAGKLILDGRVMDLFGPHAGYFVHLTEAFGPDYQWHNWGYAPHYLLLVWPLGFFGYKAAMMLFLAATGLLYWWAARRFAPGTGALLALILLPYVSHNIWVAQNGFLFAGLGLGALALRAERPVLAGIMLGFLTIKPQLGLLFPLLLLVERRWLVIASASVSTLALVALSAAIFGIDAWRGYLGEVVPYQTLVMRELGGTFLAMLTSVYGALRSWGAGADAALLGHMVLAVPALAVIVVALPLARTDADRSVLLLLAAFLVTPYALTYDLGLAMPAIALMASRLTAEQRTHGMWLALAAILPIVMMQIGNLRIPIAPVVLAACFFIALRQAGVPERGLALLRRLRRREAGQASAAA